MNYEKYWSRSYIFFLSFLLSLSLPLPPFLPPHPPPPVSLSASWLWMTSDRLLRLLYLGGLCPPTVTQNRLLCPCSFCQILLSPQWKTATKLEKPRSGVVDVIRPTVGFTDSGIGLREAFRRVWDVGEALMYKQGLTEHYSGSLQPRMLIET